MGGWIFKGKSGRVGFVLGRSAHPLSSGFVSESSLPPLLGRDSGIETTQRASQTSWEKPPINQEFANTHAYKTQGFLKCPVGTQLAQKRRPLHPKSQSTALCGWVNSFPPVSTDGWPPICVFALDTSCGASPWAKGLRPSGLPPAKQPRNPQSVRGRTQVTKSGQFPIQCCGPLSGAYCIALMSDCFSAPTPPPPKRSTESFSNFKTSWPLLLPLGGKFVTPAPKWPIEHFMEPRCPCHPAPWEPGWPFGVQR